MKKQAYKIMVIGAAGGVGKTTVELALGAGHKVIAVLRNPAKLSLTHPNLEIVAGNVMQPLTFQKHLNGVDAVISAVGDKMNEPTRLFSIGAENTLSAMAAMGVNRVYFISAAALDISPVQPWYIKIATKYIVQKLFGYGYADQRIMEALVKKSTANFTIMRPPQLTNGPVTAQYRFAVNAFLKNCLKISRADVAHFMLTHIEDEDCYGGVVEVAY